MDETDPALFVHHVGSGLTELERLVETDLGLETMAHTLAGLEELNGRLAGIRAETANRLGELMGEKRTTVMGLGTLERHADKSRRNWKHDDLLRIVLDSDRRPKNGDTGEVESDLDVLRDVYGLKGYNARITALKDRGIDADEYAESEWRGWKVSIKGAKK